VTGQLHLGSLTGHFFITRPWLKIFERTVIFYFSSGCDFEKLIAIMIVIKF
jgi:hypothetical protein